MFGLCGSEHFDGDVSETPARFDQLEGRKEPLSTKLSRSGGYSLWTLDHDRESYPCSTPPCPLVVQKPEQSSESSRSQSFETKHAFLTYKDADIPPIPPVRRPFVPACRVSTFGSTSHAGNSFTTVDTAAWNPGHRRLLRQILFARAQSPFLEVSHIPIRALSKSDSAQSVSVAFLNGSKAARMADLVL